MRKSVFDLDKTLHGAPYDNLRWSIDVLPAYFSIKKYEIGYIAWSIPFDLKLQPVRCDKFLWCCSYTFNYKFEKVYNALNNKELDQKIMDIVTRINEEDMTVKISKILFHNCDILDDVKKTVKEATEMMLNTIVYSEQYVRIGGHNNV